LVCREADLNGDGRKDIVRLYTEEGRPMREEADRDFDGRIDEVTRFTNGRVSLQEIDTSGNGMIDTKIFYENGQPERAERDMANRSTASEWRPDRWEYYADGRTVRIGTDINGDGKVDRWDRDEERLRNSALATQGTTDETASQ
jgi:antitoxin component YwqK of YwqJK toxin-antitoxin module